MINLINAINNEFNIDFITNTYIDGDVYQYHFASKLDNNDILYITFSDYDFVVHYINEFNENIVLYHKVINTNDTYIYSDIEYIEPSKKSLILFIDNYFNK